jgi:GT2 family glycosyltransferase
MNATYRLAVVFAHQGAREARLFAESLLACRRTITLHVVAVYGSPNVPALGVEDEAIRIRHWHSVSAAWNCGILHALHAGADAVLVVNDDVVLSPSAVERLTAHLGRGALAACPCVTELPAFYPSLEYFFPPGAAEAYGREQRSYDRSDPGRALTRWYAPWGGFDAFASWMAERNQGQVLGEYFHGVGFMVSSALLEEVGLFDLRFKPGYHEDVDFGRRIKALRLTSVLALDAYFHHWGKATTSTQSGWEEVCRANEEKITEKERRGFYGLSG